jgi:thiamine biosynthesis protein ThiS
MILVINGKTCEHSVGHSLPELLAALGLASGPVLVELNGRALFPREFAGVRLRDGDRLELFRVAAGG